VDPLEFGVAFVDFAHLKGHFSSFVVFQFERKDYLRTIFCH